jgi:hypothetical protein
MSNLPIWVKYALYYFIFGLLLALIGIYVGKVPTLIQIIIPIAVLTLLCRMMFKEIREKNGSEFLSYGQTFLPIFLLVMVGSFLQTVCYGAWLNFVDPASKEIVVEQAAEAAKSMGTMFGASEEAVSEAMEGKEEEMLAGFSFGKLLMTSLWSSPLSGLFLGAIFALFFRKEEKLGPY